jgi:hypothetical protein
VRLSQLRKRSRFLRLVASVIRTVPWPQSQMAIVELRPIELGSQPEEVFRFQRDYSRIAEKQRSSPLLKLLPERLRMVASFRCPRAQGYGSATRSGRNSRQMER